jgi:hypothetical protein
VKSAGKPGALGSMMKLPFGKGFGQ